ncbi:rRNA methyltransferase 3A, mitochondrial [Salminus brasiliensis]|uniref:rRNA methyltransferase 3A, mitochondrial n=1 Tax=Salminus brasiliensis TaxID=930266 RepID=UPI003B8355AD
MAALFGGVYREVALFTGRGRFLAECNRVVVNPRRSIRGLRRKPVAILHPDGEVETRTRSNQIRQPEKHTPRRDSERSSREHSEGDAAHSARGPARNTGKRTKSTGDTSDVSLKAQLGGLRYDKAQPEDTRLAKVVSIARSREFREQQGKVLLEGRRLICDALAAGASPQALFFSKVERLCELPLDKLRQASLVKVKFEHIKIWSDLVAPQGVIAIFSKPNTSGLTFPKDLRLQTVPLFLICDNIRDPGNLGTILRCAAAAGCDRVLLNKGCVDAWEPKVLRAAMGAHFRLPIFPNLDWNNISEHLPKPVTVHLADNTNKRRDVQKPGAMGWVSNGDNSDGTNLEEYVESDSDDELCLPSVKPKAYHENWAQRSTALVIGGDAHGLSSEALELAEQTSGHMLFVPMAPGVDCLNSAMTSSILLFEGRRQLMKVVQKSSRRARSVTN